MQKFYFCIKTVISWNRKHPVMISSDIPKCFAIRNCKWHQWIDSHLKQDLLCPSKKAFALFFRGRFTLHRHTVCRKPRTFGFHDFYMIWRYSCQHSHFWYLQFYLTIDLQRFTERSATFQCALMQKQSFWWRKEIAASVNDLSSVTFSAPWSIDQWAITLSS